MDKKLEKLFDDYEGNLLNYFSGLTPEQSKEFNKKHNPGFYDEEKKQKKNKKQKNHPTKYKIFRQQDWVLSIRRNNVAWYRRWCGLVQHKRFKQRKITDMCI